MSTLRKALPWIGYLALAWAIIAFLYYPIGMVLNEAFFSEGHFSFATLERLLASGRVVRSLWTTIGIGLATVVTVNIVGLFQVAVLEFFEVRFARALRLAYAIPLVFGSVAAVTGYKFVYGETGVITRLLQGVVPGLDPNWFSGAFAVLFIHSFTMTSYHFLFVRAAIRKIDFSTVEAAQSLGMKPAHAFIRVVLPVLQPTIFAVSLMVLISALGSFAAPSLLGGPNFTMISSMIQALSGLGRIDMAALMSLGLGLVTLALFLWMKHVERQGAYLSTSKSPTPIRKIRLRNPLLRGVVHALAYLLLAINVAPVLITVIFSFAPSASILLETFPTHFTLDNYIRVLSGGTAFRPLGNSIVLGLLAVSVALTIAVASASLIHRKTSRAADMLEFSLFIPWVLPGMMLAIGLIAAYDAPSLLAFGQVLVGTYWLLPIAYIIVLLPMMVRMLGAAFTGLDPNLDHAASSLRARAPYRFRRITLPLLAPVITLIAALGFNDVLSEYTLSVLLYNVNNTPLGVALSGAAAVGDPEEVAIALVYVVLLLAISFAIVTAADRLSLGRTQAQNR